MATPNLNKTASDLLAALFPVKVIDEKAETAAEIAKRLDCAGSTARDLILEQVEAGKLERVWKRGRIRLIPAYRVKR